MAAVRACPRFQAENFLCVVGVWNMAASDLQPKQVTPGIIPSSFGSKVWMPDLVATCAYVMDTKKKLSSDRVTLN
jgi:hypothetical protein